jgi:hypothetical protein
MQFLLLILKLIQAVIDAPLCQKFLVRALFAQAAFVEYQNAIGVLNSAEAMSDYQSGAAS